MIRRSRDRINFNLGKSRWPLWRLRPGAVSVQRCRLTSIRIPMLEIWLSRHPLIFNMGFPIPAKDGLYIELRDIYWIEAYWLVQYRESLPNVFFLKVCEIITVTSQWVLWRLKSPASREMHRWPVNSPHKGPVTRQMFPFDDVIKHCRVLFDIS